VTSYIAPAPLALLPFMKRLSEEKMKDFKQREILLLGLLLIVKDIGKL